MTINEFLKRIPKTGWRLDGDMQIRRETRSFWRQCPISAVGHMDGCAMNVVAIAAAQLRLSDQDTVNIMRASDGHPDCMASLRQQLLAACGLTKKAKP